MRDWWFYIDLWADERLEPRLRVRQVVDHGRVLDFSVQLEILFEGRHRTIVRYDGSHGVPHRDLLDIEG